MKLTLKSAPIACCMLPHTAVQKCAYIKPIRRPAMVVQRGLVRVVLQLLVGGYGRAANKVKGFLR